MTKFYDDLSVIFRPSSELIAMRNQADLNQAEEKRTRELMEFLKSQLLPDRLPEAKSEPAPPPSPPPIRKRKPYERKFS